MINRLFRLCSLRTLDGVLRIVSLLVPSDVTATDACWLLSSVQWEIELSKFCEMSLR